MLINIFLKQAHPPLRISTSLRQYSSISRLKSKTEYISEPSKYFDLVTNPWKIVKNVDIYGEQFVHVNWEDTESLVEPHTCSSVVVSLFVTAQDRLKLYDILEN